MKRFMIISAILSFLVLLGAFPAAFATHANPLDGRMSGRSFAISETSNSITATVYLDHLGKSHLVGTTTVTGPSDCGGFVGTEKDTITAANGDDIFIFGHGVSCPSSPALFQDTVTFSITGGTGRFADASGSGAVHTTIIVTSPTTSTFTATITGSITH